MLAATYESSKLYFLVKSNHSYKFTTKLVIMIKVKQKKMNSHNINISITKLNIIKDLVHSSLRTAYENRIRVKYKFECISKFKIVDKRSKDLFQMFATEIFTENLF